MPYVDPWAGYNEGAKNIYQAMSDITADKRTKQQDARQAALDALNSRLTEQHITQNDIKIAEQQRNTADELALRKIASENPITPEVVSMQGGYSRQDPISAAQSLGASISLKQNTAPYTADLSQTSLDDLSKTPAQLAPITPPAQLPLGGEQIPDKPVVTKEAQPATGIVKRQLDYLMSIGKTAEAMKIGNEVLDHSAKIQGLLGLEAATKFYNHEMGTDNKVSKAGKWDVVKDDKGRVKGFSSGEQMSQLIAAGTDPAEAAKKSFIPVDIAEGDGQKAILKYIAEGGNDDRVLSDLAVKYNIDMKDIMPMMENFRKKDEFAIRQAEMKQAKDASREQTKQFHEDNMELRRQTLANVGKTRMYSVLDSNNGNAPVMISAKELSEANQLEPNRFIPAAAGAKALSQQNLITDIKGNIEDTKQSASRIKGSFSKGFVSQMSLASNSNHPEAVIGNLIKSTAMDSMTVPERDYLIDLNMLIENGMAMRSVLGAGQGSDDLRNAIKATLPNAKTPNAEYAVTQLDKFKKTLDRLERGIPSIKLKPMSDEGKQLDAGTAKLFLQKAGGDKNKARQLAKNAGYSF